MNKRTKFAAIFLAAALTVTSLPVPVYAYTDKESNELELKDGVFQGSAEGFKGKITVEVTVEGGKISKIDTVEVNDTDSYWEKAVTLYDTIIDQQSTKVDVISSATYSSEGIINAVDNALSQAVLQKEIHADEIESLKGDGSSENPFIITNEAELIFLQRQVNSGVSYEGMNISLTNDINLTSAWAPIGANKSMPFSGTFNGNGHVISNLIVTNETAIKDGASLYAGLFGYASSFASFNDITISNGSILIENSDAITYAGMLVANMFNTVTNGSALPHINNVRTSGSITVKTNNKTIMAGGLAGMTNQYATVTNCVSDTSIIVSTGTGIANVGGLIGITGINGLVANNYVKGSINAETSKATSNIGGAIGSCALALYNNVSVVEAATTGGRNGGLVGNAASAAKLQNCYFAGEKIYGASSSNQIDESTLYKYEKDAANLAEMQAKLHNNLAPAALAGVSFSDLFSRVSGFFDWAIESEILTLTTDGWEPTEIDASIFEAGDGTENNPYLIASEAQLRAFATSLGKKIDYTSSHIKLANDIEVSNDQWIPIGEGEYAFMGEFDGAGHSISGICIGSEDLPYQDNGGVYYGFFGVIGNTAYVHDLRLNVSLYVKSNSELMIGGLAAYVEKSTVENCQVNGSIWGRSGISKVSANHYGGGLAGYIYRAAIVNCINNASVYSQATGGVAEAGGICGLNNRSLIANCVGNGAISGSADRVAEGMAALGGIAGVHAGTMSSCVANADITSKDYSMYVGEFAGWGTGIARFYNNYYCSESLMTIENKKVSPVESVGWLVGPGTNDEGEDYLGGINQNAESFTKAELTSTTLCEKLNTSFAAYPANLTEWSTTASLRNWKNEATQILPTGEVSAYTYVAPVIAVDVAEELLENGEYYGRSDNKELILKATITDGKTVNVEVVAGTANKEAEEYTQAYSEIESRIKLGDHTSFGEVSPAIFERGEGTSKNPFIIKTEQQLIDFMGSLNEDENYKGKYVALVSDISLSSQWKLRGGSTPYTFSGSFDGQGHTISNLKIGSEDAPSAYRYAGFFPALIGATVKNLNFDNASVYTKTEGKERYYGAVLAAVYQGDENDSYIDSINITNATIKVSTNSGAAYAAGLFASDMYNLITNCNVSADVTAESKANWNYAGILTGITARSGVINNNVRGKVSVTANLNKAAAGGIGGFVCSATYNNFADVSIKSTRYTNDLGAIAGRSTGIAYLIKDYYSSESKIISGDQAFENRGVGTTVSGTTEGKGTVGSMVSISNYDVTDLNNNCNSEEIKLLDSFLLDTWGIQFTKYVAANKWEQNANSITVNSTAVTAVAKPSTNVNNGGSVASTEAAVNPTNGIINTPVTIENANRVTTASEIKAVVKQNSSNTLEKKPIEETIGAAETESETLKDVLNENIESEEQEENLELISDEAVPTAHEKKNDEKSYVYVVIGVIILLAGIVGFYIRRKGFVQKNKRQ